jgi:hypothetical protein
MSENANPENPGIKVDPDMSPFRLGENAVYLDFLNRDWPNRVLVAQRRQPTTYAPSSLDDLARMGEHQVNIANVWDVIVSATVIRKGRPLTGLSMGHIEFQPGETLKDTLGLGYVEELAKDAIKALDALIDHTVQSENDAEEREHHKRNIAAIENGEA